MPLVKNRPEAVQGKLTNSALADHEARARLHAALNRLTAKQRAGVQRIVAAEMTGESIESLLTGEGAMCSHTTYYGAGGWSHNADFVEALRLAREINFDVRLAASVRRARELIVTSSPQAAEKLVTFLQHEDAAVSMRAALSILDRADRSTAVQAAVGVTISADDMAAAREEVRRWEAEQFASG